MSKLNGKTALITGGTTGIGLAIAKLFQAEGAQVAITGRNKTTLAEAQKTLGSKALVIQADATQVADISKAVDDVRGKLGRIDILVANAGIAAFSPIDQVTEATYDQLFDTNVKGLFFTVQKALPLIQEGGSILLTSSVVSKKGFPNTSVYSATKAAVRSFGRTLASELAPKRIRVNTLSPGPIATPIFGKMGLPADAVAATEERLAQSTLLKRLGQPEEVARVALFLVSDEASYVLGTEFFVDGGLAEL